MSILLIGLAAVATLIAILFAYGTLIGFNRKMPALQAQAKADPRNRGHILRVHAVFWTHIALWVGLGYLVYIIWSSVL